MLQHPHSARSSVKAGSSSNPRGVSIVIVLILTGIMLTFSVGASLVMTSSTRQLSRVVAANDAYYAAEGALEQGLLKMSEFGVGYDAKNYPEELTKLKANGKAKFGLNKVKWEQCILKFGQNADKCKEYAYEQETDTTDASDGSEKNKSALSSEAKWTLIGFTPEDGNYRVELEPNSTGTDGEATGEFYYSIPIAGTGDAGGEWCDSNRTIPLSTGSSGEKTGMHKFAQEYKAWLDSFKDADFSSLPSIKPTTMPAADHPCHWNRLYVSDVGGGANKPGVVTIPLFIQYEDFTSDGDKNIVIKNPASTFKIDSTTGALSNPDPFNDVDKDGGLGFDEDSEILVRFRTPCKPLALGDGEFVERTVCTADERYELDTTLDGDNVVVAWQIEELEKNPCGKVVGEACSDEEKAIYKVKHVAGPVEPGKKVKIGQKYAFNDPSNTLNNSTEVREQFLNDEQLDQGYTIIQNDTGITVPHKDNVKENYAFGKVDKPLEDYLQDVSFDLFGKVNDWDQWKLFKPVLRLTSLHTLHASDAPPGAPTAIPYLEYQVLSSVDFQPFSNSHQTVTAEAWSRGVKQTIQVKVPQETTVLQYVIQQ